MWSQKESCSVTTEWFKSLPSILAWFLDCVTRFTVISTILSCSAQLQMNMNIFNCLFVPWEIFKCHLVVFYGASRGVDSLPETTLHRSTDFDLSSVCSRWKLPLFLNAKAPATRATLTTMRKRKSESPSQKSVQRSLLSSRFRPWVAERVRETEREGEKGI